LCIVFAFPPWLPSSNSWPIAAHLFPSQPHLSNNLTSRLSTLHLRHVRSQRPTMASTKPLTMLARGLPAATLLRSSQFASGRLPSPATVAFFSTTLRRAATPSGPPPPGFRLPPPKRWDEGEGSLDRAAKYFLLFEMFRGMYVSLEQFFRPP
jgi:hypothetical protein